MKILKKYTYILFIVICCLLILITLISSLYNNTSIWWIKSTNFPRQQLLIVGFVCLLFLTVIIKKWSWFDGFLLVALLLSVAFHAWFVFPYTPLLKTEVENYQHASVKPEDKLDLFIANVYMKNRNVDGLLTIIDQAKPDMVFLLETNKWWQQELQILQKNYPHVLEYPMDNTYGFILYSKYKLLDSQILFLEKSTVPSVHTKVELPNNRKFMFHGVHPVPPVPSDRFPDNVGDEAGELDKVAQMVKEESLPAIVAGDFNDVAWSETSELFLKNSQLKDVRAGRGPYNSFSANSVIFRWPLDHIFVNPEFRLDSIARLDKFGSDHFPLLARLVLPEE